MGLEMPDEGDEVDELIVSWVQEISVVVGGNRNPPETALELYLWEDLWKDMQEQDQQAFQQYVVTLTWDAENHQKHILLDESD